MIIYRDYTISPNLAASAIPKDRGVDWEFAHKDIDLGDSRYGAGPSVEDCKRQIDEMIELEEDQ